jgi:hypothetical protein
MLPAWNDLLIPDGQAALSVNGYLFSGSLIGWRQPKLLKALQNTTKFAFRIPNKNTNNTAITAADSFWMEFTDPDTNVIRTPVVQDQFQRYYWANPSDLPHYNTYDRIVGGQHPWILGVPASGCSPGVVVDGGGSTVVIGQNSTVFGGNSIGYPANQMMFIPVTPDGTLLLDNIQFVSSDTNATIAYQGAIYTNLNNQPYQLLGETNIAHGLTANSTATVSFTNPVAVQPNTTYWLGVMFDQAVDLIQADKRSNIGTSFVQTFTNGPPSIAPGATLGVQTLQIWGNFEGSSVFEARAYVFTWVTAYGEEGPPSPATLVNGWSNATWTISLYTPLPADMGGTDRNITKVRIYRTVTSNTGLSTYFQVVELPVGTASYQDTSGDDTVALNPQLASFFWSAPPTDLQGISAFPNGITVGFRSNEVWFSEPFRPHAWPPSYVLTTEFPIVGLGVCGQAVVVCTEGTPYVIVGTSPATMAMTKVKLHEPCINRGSIISTDTTVLYASQNGLIQVSQSGLAGNVSESWISRERWQALTPQTNVRAIKHATSYFAFGTVSRDGSDVSVAQQGYTVELSNEDQTSFTVWPQAGGHRLGFSQLVSPNAFNIVNVLVDEWTGVGLLLQNHGIYYYDFTDQAPTIVPYKWRSKIFQGLTKKNYSAVRVFFTIPPNTPAQGAINTADPQPVLGPNQYGILRAYADGNLLTTREIRTSGSLLRIYSTTKVEQWQFELEGRVNITNMQVGTSVKELGEV